MDLEVLPSGAWKVITLDFFSSAAGAAEKTEQQEQY